MGFDKKIMMEYKELEEAYNLSLEDVFNMGVTCYRKVLEEKEKECELIDSNELLKHLEELEICRQSIILNLINEEITNQDKLRTVLKLRDVVEFVENSLNESEGK
ncbi:hypothetical protein [Clostridium tagluense]|uniref:Uncharacterized protein n=1 Tax=Clostridium tagluense TaxID=360422 RepID=A0A401UPE2_9CLOT|nr:hypothetical protein [Clostridium tagluense]GCD11409.1 hypothetical protein Ctaglu_30320 [Clostridium tagluense]